MRVPVLRSLAAAVLTMTISVGCTTSRNTRPGANPMDPTRAAIDGKVPGQRAGGSTEANVSRKRVDSKEEPATLVAADRTRCTVTEQRFRDTKVGDNATCDWRTGSRAP
jgi:hypothetical protein